jgi:hypothetical protein
MSTYRKDRNNIIITLDGASGDYRLDINTGILYGVKGTPIKTCPRKREVVDLFPRWEKTCSNLAYVVGRMIDRSNQTATFVALVGVMQSADKIDALGIDNLSLYDEQYIYLANNIKWVQAWKKEHAGEDFRFHQFKTWCDFEKVRNQLGSVANLLTAEMYHELLNHRNDFTLEELGVCAYYLGRGKYWEYHNRNVGNLVHYIVMCRAMEKEPQKVNNFMREYCETLKEYELRRQEFDNKKMAINYAGHREAWNFEFGDYKVFIPSTAQEIIDEGRNMHHCVGSYVNRVVNNECYICFIRRKDTPNECYITCQVYTNGDIGQYFLAYDHYISSDEDKAFKEAFRQHLAQVWG